jgi:hypothetical protein
MRKKVDTPPTQTASQSILLGRGGLARLSSGVGASGVVLAILLLLLNGEVSLLTVGALVVGLLGLAIWIALAPDDFRALLTGRQAAHGGNSIVAVVLVAGIVALLYFMSASASIGIDLTSVGYYSLKPDVKPVLANLAEPIQITAFYNRAVLGQKSVDAPILKLFTDADPTKVRIAYIDPDEQPLVAQSFGLSANYGLFVSYLQADGSPDLRPARTVPVRGDFANEKLIAESILQLQAQGLFKVVFTTGAGELSTESDVRGIWDGLRSVGIQTSTLDLVNDPIPADTTALVMLAPWLDFTQATVDKIAAYMANGGKLMLLAEPSYDSRVRFMIDDASPMLNYLWDTWGVRPQRVIMCGRPAS